MTWKSQITNPLFPHFSSSSVDPAVLYASQEARRVALRSYQVFFSEKLCRNLFYFNPAVDTIFLPSYDAYEAFMQHTSDCDVMKLIRYLAIRIDLHFRDPISEAYENLARFENLESLMIHFAYKTGPGLEPMERFELRAQLQRLWKKEKNDETNLEKKIVMQNPDIVFLGTEEMKILELVI